MWLSVPRVIFVLVFASVVPAWATQPNIIIVLADDLGWKDVGYNDSEVQTPTIDRLAASGVKLKRYYAQPTCSPTRTSLMTGQAAVRNGVYLPIDKNNLSGLPLDQKILPQYFKEAGYQTSLIGKWHLGHAYRKQLPTSRGFDYHYGHLTGGIGHWDHLHGGGLDWQRDGAALREEGYSTHLMTNEAIRQIEQRDRERPFFMYLSYAAPHLPNEAPAKTVGKYSSIVGENRRVHAAMVNEIDQGLAELVATLEREGIQDNTLLWFMSDNGGLLPGAFPPTLERIVSTLVDWTGKPLPINTLEFVRTNVQDGGSDNGPYRRGKGSIYEGGVLVPSFLILPGRLPPNEVSSRVTVQDVLPTLAAVVGLELSEGHKLDGTNQWPIIKGEATAISGDYLIAGMDGEAYYQGDWKLVMVAGEEPALYNLENDPTEQRDLAGEEAERVEELRKRLEQFPRGESIHQTAWYDIFLDPDRFGGGGEDRLPWIEQVREQ